MKIYVGADPYGCNLASDIKSFLEQKGFEVLFDKPESEDEKAYYKVASRAATKIQLASVDRAILICGSGMGMAITANKYPGIYAALCENKSAAIQSRIINNSNVLTLGENVTSTADALEIVDAWLHTDFKQGLDEDLSSIVSFYFNGLKALEKNINV